jgi:hypothetical protein
MNATDAVQALTAARDADVILYFGDLFRSPAERIVDQCRARRRRKNALLVLSTFGGDVAAAYLIARCLQRAYNTKADKEEDRGEFSILGVGMCKSAGTLLCLGADRLFMTEGAELGPIDVQLRKPEEVGERTSGLTPLQALETLQTHSLNHFKRHFRQLRFDDELAFSTKSAAEIATNLSVGLLKEMYSQLDPLRLAEVERSLRVASDYGERISTSNVREGGLARLLAKYPTHNFIIDRTEAHEIFEAVENPTSEMEAFVQQTASYLDRWVYGDNALATYASDEPVDSRTLGGAAHEKGTAIGESGPNPGGEQSEVRQATGTDDASGSTTAAIVSIKTGRAEGAQ